MNTRLAARLAILESKKPNADGPRDKSGRLLTPLELAAFGFTEDMVDASAADEPGPEEVKP